MRSTEVPPYFPKKSPCLSLVLSLRCWMFMSTILFMR